MFGQGGKRGKWIIAVFSSYGEIFWDLRSHWKEIELVFYSDNSRPVERERSLPLKTINIIPLSSSVFDCYTVFDI